MSLVRRGQTSYRQGLVLTSISQGWNSPSIMKSSPNISKLCLYLQGEILTKVLFTASIAIYFILGKICSQKLYFSFGWFESKYFWNSRQETLFAGSYLPQLGVYFWMASLVRCISLSKLWMSNQYEAVRIQPSLNQQALKMPLIWLIIIQCLISNFLFLYRKGRSIQSCTIKVFSLPLSCLFYDFIIESNSYISSITVMPFPLLVSSPGLTIHILRIGLCLRLPFSSYFSCFLMCACLFLQQATKRLYCGSFKPVFM